MCFEEKEQKHDIFLNFSQSLDGEDVKIHSYSKIKKKKKNVIN